MNDELKKGAGLVSLVGAGPGDPGLLTRKAVARLEQADVVVHDELVSAGILALVRPGAEVVHRREIGDGSQDALNQHLVRLSRRGKTVVRLKGGDPFLFGRGAEEAEVLAAAGIPWDVVPGVSAGLAVAAYAGIPLTHRKYASQVIFVTGHEDPGKQDAAIAWDRVVRAGGTLVVFMAVRRLPDVVLELRKAGAEAQTPVAVIEWGTTPRQRTVVGDLSDIVDLAQSQGLDHPALVVVGAVVKLRERLAWFDRRPLWGRRVLVTRAPDQAPALVESLRDVGAGVLQLPVLEFQPPESVAPVEQAITDLRTGAFDWVVFTSKNGVDTFVAALHARGYDLRVFGRAKVACIGPATAEALRKHGIVADLVPKDFRSEGLRDALLAGRGVRGQRFLLLRAEVGRDVLPDTLREAGAIVDLVATYRTVRPGLSGDRARQHIELSDTVTFTSPSSLENLLAMLGERGEDLLAQRTLACIGPITAQALAARGLTATITARVATVAGLVDALVDDARTRTRT